jgi:hypothetical protein
MGESIGQEITSIGIHNSQNAASWVSQRDASRGEMKDKPILSMIGARQKTRGRLFD